MDDNEVLSVKHCRTYYENQYDISQSALNALSLETVLHAFLNGSPSSARITLQDRALGLATANFWQYQQSLADSQIVKFALSQLLRFDQVLPFNFVQTIIALDPNIMRWTIRYSRIFENPDSVVYKHLREKYKSEDWLEFFAVCDRLLVQLEPYKAAIHTLEKKLKFMTVTDLFCYLSVLAWQKYFDSMLSGKNADLSRVYDRLLQMKLVTTKPETLQVTSESKIAQSIRQNLMPLLMPESYPQHASSQCAKNLQLVAELFWNTQELIDYEGSIDWFCYDEKCRYQYGENKSILFNEDDLEDLRWGQTGQKSNLLWHYWFNRGVEQFLSSDLASSQIGSAEYQDANLTAVTKSMRSCLQLEALYGIGNTIAVTEKTDIPLFELMLTNELHSAMFNKEYVSPLYEKISAGTPLLAALKELMMQGFLDGENRLPFTWSDIKTKTSRIKDWYLSEQTSDSREAKAQAAISFWSQNLKNLAEELKSPNKKPIARLHEKPFLQLGNFFLQLPWQMADSNHFNAAVNNLRRLNSRRPELQTETQNAEENLAISLRALGFKVVVGYQPEKSADGDAGEIDLICHKDGVVLMLEVKTGYIRSSAAEIWLHRNTTLRKASWQLQRKSAKFPTMLLNDESLKQQLDISGDDYKLHGWIVDTCIEFDGQLIGCYRVVSRETLEVVMRDEMHMLCSLEHLKPTRNTLYPEGFSAQKFADVIESEAVWKILSNNI